MKGIQMLCTQRHKEGRKGGITKQRRYWTYRKQIAKWQKQFFC